MLAFREFCMPEAQLPRMSHLGRWVNREILAPVLVHKRLHKRLGRAMDPGAAMDPLLPRQRGPQARIVATDALCKLRFE